MKLLKFFCKIFFSPSNAILYQEKALIKLKRVFSNDFQKAIDYNINSTWSIDDLCKYGSIHGDLPPEKVRWDNPKVVINLHTLNTNFLQKRLK